MENTPGQGGNDNGSIDNQTPAEESQGGSGLAEVLEKIGVSQSQVQLVRDSFKDMNVEDSLEKARTYINDALTKARDYAKKNPAVVVGALSGLVIAAGLLTAATRRDK